MVGKMAEYISVAKGTTVKIIYHGRASGLSDVTIEGFNTSDTEEIASATSMTEIGSSGSYLYSHSFSDYGTFILVVDSASTPLKRVYFYDVIE